MKIAIVSFFHAESSLCLAKYLAKAGNEVDYYYVAGLYHTVDNTPGFEYSNASHVLGNHKLTPKETPIIYNYLEGLPVTLYLTRILHHDMYPRFNDVLIRILFKQIKRKGYDAINVVGQYSKVGIAHEVFKGCNLIQTFHELGNHEGELIPLPTVVQAVKDKTKVILHSNATYERYVGIEGVDEANVRMIPFGKFETCKIYAKETNVSLPFTEDVPMLLFYGYLAPYKGLDILAEAMEHLKDIHSKFNVVIAGSGENDDLHKFEQYNNCHIIHRFLSNDEMMALIKQSSAILLPYRTASQTGIIPTCTLYGKPFIATNVGAFKESVLDGVNGLLVEKDSPIAFADAMRKVIESPELLKSLSDGAYHYGEDDDFSWSLIAKKTIEFYNS